MGQYWILVNLDKHEFVNPHKLGVGSKLWEQAASGYGTGTAMLVLCAAQREHRGGGDLNDNHPVTRATVGRWAGDRVTLVGDYAEDGDLAPEHHASEIWDKCKEGKDKEPAEWLDISDDVAHVVEELTDSTFWGDGWRDLVPNGKKPEKNSTAGNKSKRSLPPVGDRIPTVKGGSQPQAQAPGPSTEDKEAEAIAEEMVSSSEDKP